MASMVIKFFLVQLCKGGNLQEGQRLERLYFAMEFGGQPWDEATQQGWRGETNYAVRKAFKLNELVIHWTVLLKLE